MIGRRPQRFHSHAQGVQIAAHVGGRKTKLLRRRKTRRAHDQGVVAFFLGRGQTGGAKINQLHAAVFPQNNIAGLNVPVQDMVGVQNLKGLADLVRDAPNLGLGQIFMLGG